jgi:hypothetical protein
METLKIKHWNQSKPITVRSYMRGATLKAKVASGISFAQHTHQLKLAYLTALAALSFMTTIFYAGAVSTFTEQDWAQIAAVKIDEIGQYIPGIHAHAEEIPVVMVNGVSQSLCSQVIKDQAKVGTEAWEVINNTCK